MRSLSFGALVVVVVAILGAVAVNAQQPLVLTTSIGRFSLQLLDANVAVQADDNTWILSPFSVLTDLSMAWLGANGGTAAELAAGLQLGSQATRSQVGDAFRALLQPLQAAQSPLRVVNRIYVNRQFSVKPQFNQLIGRDFFAGAESLDFGRNQEAAATINRYVAAHTNQQITGLVDAGQLSANTRMVLINAVHFKAPWAHPFPKRATQKMPFFVNVAGVGPASVQLDFMQQTRSFRYADLPRLNSIMVGLPYKTGGYVMNVVLPNASGGGGLTQLRTALRNGDLSRLSAAMAERNIDLRMPKFTSRTKATLNGPLERLGIRTAFTPQADFGDLLAARVSISISAVLHEAYIKVDEDGTEAAAATGT